MSFYRERFGHREGEFPVCEDVAARSVALPFFPEMTTRRSSEVAEGLKASCAVHNLAMASGPLGRDQLSRRRARRVGAVGFVLACALPFALWHSVMADIASQARIDLRYLLMECRRGC